jgi:hypothetical protein
MLDKAPTNDIPQAQTDVPAAEARAEEKKLVTIDIGNMSFDRAQEKIAELNRNLEEREEPWKLKSTNDISKNLESVESTKLEWGPSFSKIDFDMACNKINEINKDLKEGEKPWRVPTTGELLADFYETGSTPVAFFKGEYWSVTSRSLDHGIPKVVDMGDGHVQNSYRGELHLIRCVRSIFQSKNEHEIIIS